jgi:hypothetical protein
MRRLALLSAVVLSGCAITPQQSQDYVAGLGNWDVCRLTMGGPHARAAEHEARNRGVDCAPLYPAIAAQMQGQNAAILQYLQNTRPQPIQQAPVYQIPQPTTCTSQRLGSTVQTICR